MGSAADTVNAYNAAWFEKDLTRMADFLADDLVLWHNHIGRKFSKPEMLGFIAAALDVIDKVEFRNARQLDCNGAALVQQHDLYVRMKDGTVMETIPNCIIYTLREDKIMRIEEYVDGSALNTVKIAQ
jgi:ketosteroid isomerase-like protein